MKGKTIIIFFVIFVLLALGALLPFFQQKVIPSSPMVFDFSKYSKTSTSRIHINTLDNEVTLTKEGDYWKTEQHKVSQQKIDDFFASLETVTDEVVVSTNEQNFRQYGIATSSSTKVQLNNSDTQIRFEIGNIGPGGNSFYARIDSGKEVYLVNGDLATNISARKNDWREKRIVNLPSNEIINVDVEGIDNFSLHKSEETWEYIAGEQKKVVQTEEVLPHISSLANLTAHDFYTEEEIGLLELSEQPVIVTIQSTTGNQITLTIRKDDSNYLVQKNGEIDIYKVPGYSLTNFLQLPNQIK